MSVDTACQISEKQNSEQSLRYIAAWSQLYGYAKIIAAWQFWLAVPGALAMSVCALIWPDAKVVTTPLALFFGWVDLLFLDPIQNERKKIAAKTQELFDCELFKLEWNNLRCSPKPDSETINEAAEEFKKSNDTAKHPDWYPTEVKRVPLALARLICQRAAVWWDMSQRRRYGRWVLGLSLLLITGIFIISFTGDLKVRDMILGVYLPFAPVVVWAVREYRRQRDAAIGLEKLKGQIEEIFNQAIEGKLDQASLERHSRNIQDMIYDGRFRNPVLFNSIYRWLRDKHEVRMNEKAKELVEKAIANQSTWKF